MPVSAVVEGDANIMGEREHIMIEIDYSDFIEVFSSYNENSLTFPLSIAQLSMPREFYQPPKDLWCNGRRMEDPTPYIPAEISYTEEIIMKWLNADVQPIDVVLSRNVW